MRFHQDGRRRFIGDIFSTPWGDINAVTLYPGVRIGWHRHQKQVDHIFVLYGSVEIRAMDREGKWHRWDMDAPHGAHVCIPPQWWHGYASADGATLIQFNGPGKWTENNPDEERHPIDDEMPWI